MKNPARYGKWFQGVLLLITYHFGLHVAMVVIFGCFIATCVFEAQWRITMFRFGLDKKSMNG